MIFIFYPKRLQRRGYQEPFDESAFYGFTKKEGTGQYLLVLQYFEDGDLRKQLQRQAMDWNQKIEMICYIALNMSQIHDS